MLYHCRLYAYAISAYTICPQRWIAGDIRLWAERSGAYHCFKRKSFGTPASQPRAHLRHSVPIIGVGAFFELGALPCTCHEAVYKVISEFDMGTLILTKKDMAGLLDMGA